jgi:opine dehydrogenase
MTQRVTVLGAGNGGLTTAFHLASIGIDVLLWAHPDYSRTLDQVKQRGGIEAAEKMTIEGMEIEGHLKGFAAMACTSDIREAVAFSDILLLILPSFAHEEIFRLVMPHLRAGQTMAVLPGNFSSLVFTRIMNEQGIDTPVTFLETNTLPYGCRLTGPGQILVIMIRNKVKAAAFPGNRTMESLEKLKKVLPIEILPRSNVLEPGFANPNLITHSVTATLNMGWIESDSDAFHFYKEGMSESIVRAIMAIDDERMSIGEKFTMPLIPYLDVINAAMDRAYSSLREYVIDNPLKSTIGYSNPKGPADRYITEDTPYLLVPVHELGKVAGVPHPAMESIITLAGIFNERDYFKEGRTLEKMGLAGMSVDEILSYVVKGMK